MKKIILVLLIAVMVLTQLTSCAKTVKIPADAEVALAYQLDGTSVTSSIAGNNAALLIDNLNGRKISNEAPEGAEYVDTVYFMVGDDFYHVDLNGAPVFRINKGEGYVEIEQYRFDAIVSLFTQYGVSFAN